MGTAEDQGPASKNISICCYLSLGSLHFWESLKKIWCVCVFFKPDSDMDPNSGGEGVNSVSIKRGLSVDSAQEVKRFRAATGAISAVRTCVSLCVPILSWGSVYSPCILSVLEPAAPEAAGD